LSIIAGADTIYVDDDFIDNPLLHQWDTITEGIADANPGDIVYIYNGVYNETVVVNKTLNLTGESNSGTIIDGEGGSLPLWINASNVNVSSLSVFNSSGYCLNVTGSNVSLSNCRIFNNSGVGINVRNSADFTLNDCNIFNNNKTGVNIVNSDRSIITGTTISTTGTFGYGLYIRNSNNSVLTSCRINTTGTSSFGIYQDGETLRIYNSKINSSTNSDIYIVNQGTMISINCTFSDLDVEQDGGGVLIVKNYLTIKVTYSDGATPIQGADVEVRDNSNQIYASSGYGGTDGQTDANGRVGPILVQDRWYNLSNTPIENITDIKAKKTINLTWEGTLSDVNMSTSHTESMSATDIISPPKPTGLTVIRIPATNDLNISWNQNLDTFNYSAYYSVGGSSFTLIANVTHPKNWTMHLNLTDGNIYRYTIRAWDWVGLRSPYSDVVSFNLTDITPPAIPKNLSAKPLVNDDELEISWDQNTDDTVNYELWFTDAVSGPWTKVGNVTHPTNFTTFSDPILVNGSTYYLKIRAWDEMALGSGYSVPISVVHIDYVAPGAPTGLTAVAESISNITLTWSAPIDADVQGYRVYINQSGVGTGGPYYFQSNINTLTYQLTDLRENTTYYFVVRAFDEANRLSVFSEEAENTTLSQQPGKPLLDTLPEYTNNPIINISGTADKFITILVLNNGLLAGSGSTDTNGTFKIQITLVEDLNVINARARNNALVEGPPSEPQNITLDTQKPIAIAGEDLNIFTGQKAIFSAASSTDNYGIDNYTWSFDDFGGNPVKLYGEEAEYKFNQTGNFEVTLTLIDVAGNLGTDTLWVNVQTIPLEQPVIKNTVPDNNSVNVPVDVKVIITFSLPMDTDSVASVLKIIPDTGHNLLWNTNKTEITIEFTKNLEYDNEYSISVGKAKAVNGLELKDAPIVLVFNTETAPGIPKITITTQPGETEVKPGETITISGTSTGMLEGTQVTVILGDQTVYDTVAADGSWSVSIKAPEAEGVYDLTVEIDTEKETGSVIIKEPTAPGDDDEDDDKGLLGFGPLMDYLIILIIIIIIIILVMLALRKKPKEEQVQEDEVAEEEEIEEEELEEEELEEEELIEDELEEGEVEAEAEELHEDELDEVEPEEEDLEEDELEEEEPEEEELTEQEPEEEPLTEEETEPTEETEETDLEQEKEELGE
jgi:parallel beta-helix repeat protein